MLEASHFTLSLYQEKIFARIEHKATYIHTIQNLLY